MPRLSSVALVESSAVWHADAWARPAGAVLATGHAPLDAQLPGGGWPVGALVEILQAPDVRGEWRLLLSALARAGPGPVVLVGAPHIPFGPALAAQGLAAERLLWITSAQPASRLWACEQTLRCAGVSAVLVWLPQARSEQLRRLQMAASENAKLLFVMRPAQTRAESSPAVLRLLVSVQAGSDDLRLDIVKRRGPPCAQAVCMPARNGHLAALLARSQRRAGCGSRQDACVAGSVTSCRVALAVKASDVLDRIASAA